MDAADTLTDLRLHRELRSLRTERDVLESDPMPLGAGFAKRARARRRRLAELALREEQIAVQRLQLRPEQWRDLVRAYLDGSFPPAKYTVSLALRKAVAAAAWQQLAKRA